MVQDAVSLRSVRVARGTWVPFTEVGLKSPSTPYVATIGHPEEAQATLRIDQQGSGYEYKYVTYRRLERT